MKPSIPDYELFERVGAGAYGEVWLAKNVLGLMRAVKVVYRGRFSEERPFDREFEGITQFEPISRSHRSQLAIFHVGLSEAEGYFYYVMELADNAAMDGLSGNEFNSKHLQVGSYRPRTLRSEIEEKGRLAVAECVEIGLSLAKALEHLHEQGLVHRDIKPSNVVFVAGVPKLGDIGLVTSAGDTQSIVGTEGYIPPEGPGTVQADIYSLGKVLYEVSTGMDRRRFPELPEAFRSSPQDTAFREFNRILLGACARDVRSRYQSSAEVIEDLARVQEGNSLKRAHVLRQVRTTFRRRWKIATASAILMAGALLGTTRSEFERFRAADIEVPNLVAQGDQCALNETPERQAQALQYYEEALRLDPLFVPALIGRFRVRLGEHSGTNARHENTLEKMRESEAELRRAAPALAESRIAHSTVLWFGHDRAGALREGELAAHSRAASLKGRTMVHVIYGWYLLNIGEPDRALREFQFAERDDPTDPGLQRHMAQPYLMKHDFPRAIAKYDEALKREPRQFWARFCKGAVYEHLEDFPNAMKEYRAADLLAGRDQAGVEKYYEQLNKAWQERGRNGYWQAKLDKALESAKDLHGIAVFYERLGQHDEAYRWLQRACDAGQVEGLWADLCWDHNDERFKKIAAQVGLKP